MKGRSRVVYWCWCLELISTYASLALFLSHVIEWEQMWAHYFRKAKVCVNTIIMHIYVVAVLDV